MFHRSLNLFAAALVAVAACTAPAFAAEPAKPAAKPEAKAAEPKATEAKGGSLLLAAAPASSASAVPVSSQAAAPAAQGAPLLAAAPATTASAPVAGTLDGRIQDVKGDVIKLNRDLLVLEEELLFPASTQVALFVSMDVGKMFELDSVQIKLDDKMVSSYLYTPNEVAALHRGGVQRIYLGNLRTGEHELVAFFTGKGPHDRDYKRGATVKFEKGSDPKYIELQIKDSMNKLQPEFEVKVWQ